MEEKIRLIPLSGKKGKGLFTKVSEHRYEYLNKFNWSFAGKKPRVTRSSTSVEAKANSGKFYLISMHREIMGFPELQVDHIDGDVLNNTDSNLRLATAAQNSYNKHKFKENKLSEFVGVTKGKKSNKWTASIGYKGESINLGNYATEKEAALVRDGAAIALHGDFAVLNFSKDLAIPYIPKEKKVQTSAYKGVYFDSAKEKWVAAIRTPEGKAFKIKYCLTEIGAARVYDGASIYFYGDLGYRNLPEIEPIPYVPYKKTSKYKGVSYNKRTNKWTTMLWENKKSKFLGVFKSEEDAYKAVLDYQEKENFQFKK